MGLLQFLGLKRKKITEISEPDSIKYIGGTERHIWRIRGVKGYVTLKMHALSVIKGKPIADILEELVNQADDILQNTILDEKTDRKVKRLLKKRFDQRYPKKE